MYQPDTATSSATEPSRPTAGPLRFFANVAGGVGTIVDDWFMNMLMKELIEIIKLLDPTVVLDKADDTQVATAIKKYVDTLPNAWRIGRGLTLKCVAGGNVEIQPGAYRDSGNSVLLALAALTRKIPGIAWAPGDLAGGGLSVPTDGWARVFAIGMPDGTTDAGLDTSATAANLLAEAVGYTVYRQLGWAYFVSSTLEGSNEDPLAPGSIVWTGATPPAPVLLTPATSATLTAVPAAPASIADLGFFCEIAAAGGGLVHGVRIVGAFEADIAPVGLPASGFNLTAANTVTAAAQVHTRVQVRVNASSQVSHRWTSAGTGIFTDPLLTCRGYQLDRAAL